MRLSRTKTLILLFTAATLVSVSTFVVIDVWRRHERALEAADARARSL